MHGWTKRTHPKIILFLFLCTVFSLDITMLTFAMIFTLSFKSANLIPQGSTVSLPSKADVFPVKPAAHLRKQLSKLPCRASWGNQLSSFLKCEVEFSWEFHLARWNLRYQTRQIFSSRTRKAKNSRKQNRTHDETAERYSPREAVCSALSSSVRQALAMQSWLSWLSKMREVCWAINSMFRLNHWIIIIVLT